MRCLDENTLAGYLSGLLTATRLADVEMHLESGCLDCQEALTWAARIAPPAEDSAFVVASNSAAVGRGHAVGRYLLIGRLGAGAMGVVWSAYDPELDRKLAIKLLHPERQGGESDAMARSRLVREAQALARVAHPNVIAVYDVGDIDQRVFVAMELVRGKTLADWLVAKSRTRTEILDVFHQAGLGLQAAHTAGLVHRDFKPANVLVGDDGRVRVVDFGLARTASSAEPATARVIPRSAANELVTRAGMMLGTPAYMAPEQRVGAVADARADQFAFCVALAEALTGQRPQAESEVPLRGVSLWMQKILARGMKADRDARFPSMEALLTALERDPAVRRRRSLGAIAALSILVFGAVGLRVALRRREAVCASPARKLEGIWDAPRRAQLAAHVRSLSVTYAESAVSGITTALDRYSDGFAAMHTEACEATRTRGEQSEELLDLRIACLGERAKELRAATDLLLAADSNEMRSAMKVVDSLVPLERCADAVALRGQPPMPRGVASRRAIEAAAARVASARVLEEAGDYERGRALAGQAVEDATPLDYAPLLGEALCIRGLLEADAGDFAAAERSLSQAVLAAERGRDDRGAARARVELALVIDGLGRHVEALRWVELATVSLGRIAGDPILRATVTNAKGRILRSLAHWDEAEADLVLALHDRERVLGPHRREVAATLVDLGDLALDRGRPNDALPVFERALHELETALGSSHPDLAPVMDKLGTTLAELRRWDEAKRWLERALELRTRTLGPGAANLAPTLVGLGEIALQRGDAATAVALLERAYALPMEKQAKRDVAFPLARALWEMGRDRKRAQTLLATARSAYDPALSSDRIALDAIAKWSAAHSDDKGGDDVDDE